METKNIFVVTVSCLFFLQALFAGRMYDSRTGRFTTPDPALQGNQQFQMKKYGPKLFSESPYDYSFNNPIKYVDPDGKWPTKVHNQIFDKALSNSGITMLQLSYIKDGSYSVDH